MAKDGWFSYTLHINKTEQKPYHLICRFWGDEPDTCQFDILIDGNYLRTVKFESKTISDLCGRCVFYSCGLDSWKG